MIKLSAGVSKKMPIPNVEFSSQSYSAGMEIEVSSGTSQEELKQKLRTLYGLLEASIDEQIGQQQMGEQKPKNNKSPAAMPKVNTAPTNTNTHKGRAATKAQVRAIHAIAEDQGYTEEGVKELLSATYGVETSSGLSIGQASSLIDALKNNGQE